jgi:hypothetical protein
VSMRAVVLTRSPALLALAFLAVSITVPPRAAPSLPLPCPYTGLVGPTLHTLLISTERCNAEVEFIECAENRVAEDGRSSFLAEGGAENIDR